MASDFDQLISEFDETLYYFTRARTYDARGATTAAPADGTGTAFLGWLRPTTQKDLEQFAGWVETGDFLLSVTDTVKVATSIVLHGIVGDAATPTRKWEITAELKGANRKDHNGEVVPHLYSLREQTLV